MTALFESVFSEITLDSNVPAVCVCFKRFCSSEQFRTTLEKGLEILIATQAPCWLADMRKMPVVAAEDEQWVADYWFPRAAKETKRRFSAIVVDGNKLIGLMLDGLKPAFDDFGVQVQRFPDPDTAKAWLRQCAASVAK